MLSLHDNAVGLPASPTPAGMRTAVISACTQSLDGARGLESADVGARLTAAIAAGSGGVRGRAATARASHRAG